MDTKKNNILKNILGAAIIFIILIITLISQPVHFIDDAWITLRFADNLIHHGQLVLNLGERVEGISNALWALILAFLGYTLKVSVDKVDAYFSLILVFYLLYRLWGLGKTIGLNPLIASLPILMLILTSDFSGTITNGLETPLLAVLLLEILYGLITKKHAIVMLMAGLLFITRIETVALGFLLCLLLLFNVSSKTESKKYFINLSIYAFVVITVTAIRIGYYGDFIPNSVRAKLAPIQLWILLDGVRYVISFLSANLHFTFLLMLLIAIIVSTKTRVIFSEPLRLIRYNGQNQALVFCISGIALSFVIAIKNGGDWMPHYRLLSQYGVLFAFLLLFSLEKKFISVIATLALITGPFLQTSVNAITKWQEQSEIKIVDFSADMELWSEITDRLSTAVIRKDVISAEGIGYISYKLNNTYIHDPTGLAEKYIAENGTPAILFGKMDLPYTIYEVNPSIMIWHYSKHLIDIDAGYLDKNYTTFCYKDCYGWDADIIMIRNDRAQDLKEYFTDWKLITIESLHKTSN